MEFLFEYGLFLAKAVTFVIAIAIIAGVIAMFSMRIKSGTQDHVEIKHLNEKYKQMKQLLQSAILPKEDYKKQRKELKKQAKAEKKQSPEAKKRLYVIDFDGDIRGTEVASLREEITAILTTAEADDEVLLKLESAGGMVHAYGLAASQLQRIKEKQVKLTVAVDKVAASGGYLMACVADKIIAAPFAIIGSIGVLSQIPNFNRFLKKHDIDFEQITAGEYKRTISLFGETTEKARKKMKQEVEETHQLFKNFVNQQRPDMDIESVATGEHWLASRALELNLIDELRTSDDYLLAASENADIYEVKYIFKHTLKDKLSSFLSKGRSLSETALETDIIRSPLV